MHVLLADFGFAQKVMPGTMLKTYCGTTGYMAPEIINDKVSISPNVSTLSCCMCCVGHLIAPDFFIFNRDMMGSAPTSSALELPF